MTSKAKKIFVAGHRGMVGSAIVRLLEARGYNNILKFSRKELDLKNQTAVFSFLKSEKPDYIFIAAAKVGGISANNIYRADFLYENLILEANIIHGAFLAGIERLCFLGSSCIYPRDCPQPIREEYLLTGALEQTNEPYAIAKIAGVKMCENYNRQYGTKFVSLMPTNLYGPNDNYDLHTSHVLPALIRKIDRAHDEGADSVTIWGSGRPRREFLHVDDLARACIHVMESEISDGLFNVGVGSDLTIEQLARKIIAQIGFRGDLSFDRSKPDGTPQKLLDVSQLRSKGWEAQIPIDDGLAMTINDFRSVVKPKLNMGITR